MIILFISLGRVAVYGYATSRCRQVLNDVGRVAGMVEEVCTVGTLGMWSKAR